MSSRADRVAARLAEREADLLLVTDLVNLRYLTGFTGSNALAVVGPDTRRFLTDFRYMEAVRTQVSGFDLQTAPQELADRMHRLWIDFARDGSLPWAEFDRDTRQVYRIEAGSAAHEPAMPAAAYLP